MQNWNPTANSTVYDLATDGTYIYAAGQFSMMNVSARNGLACVSSTGSGGVQSWNPAANAGANFRAIYISGAKVYVGGTCSMIGATARTNFAVVDTDAVLQSLAPNPNGIVYDITGDATNLYVGGAFTNINSTSRNYLVSYLLSNNSLRTWDPVIVGSNVQGISLLSNKVYFGGQFTSVKASGRTNLAGVDNTNSTVLQAWNPSLNSTVYCVSAAANDIFAGGAFTETGINGKYNYLRGYDTGPVPGEVINPGEQTEFAKLRLSNATVDGILIYPNPSNNHFYIEMNSLSEKTRVEILDANMKMVLSDEITEGSIPKEINLSDMPAGMYFVIISNSNNRNVFKLMKE